MANQNLVSSKWDKLKSREQIGREVEKERGQERSISIGTKQHDNKSEQAQQNCVVCIEQNMHSRINTTHTTTRTTTRT